MNEKKERGGVTISGGEVKRKGRKLKIKLMLIKELNKFLECGCNNNIKTIC